MAITAANILEEASAVDATNYTTASVSPTANRLYVLTVVNSIGADPATPTATHAGGLTFVQIGTSGSAAGLRTTVFRAMKSSGLSAGTINVTAAPETATGWIVILDEFAGVDTSGTDGSGAIIQSPVGTGSGTTSTVVLASFADAVNNAAFGAMGLSGNQVITPEVGHTELGNNSHTSPSRRGITEWKIGEDTAVTFTWTGAQTWHTIGAELKMDVAVATAKNLLLIGVGGG